LSDGKVIVDRSEFFFEMEARDEQQMIKEYEGKVLSEITYQVQGQTAISYDGIKFIVGKLGRIKVLPESIKAEFIEKPEQMWVASVVAINEKYDIQLPGAGEQPYLMKAKGELVPDPFARRKAISKATRNALRAVIPEPMIIKFLEDVEKGSDFNPPKTRDGIREEVEAEFTEKVDPPVRPDPNNVKEYFSNLGYDPKRFTVWEDEPTGLLCIKIKGFFDNPDFKDHMKELGAFWDKEQKTYVVNL